MLKPTFENRNYAFACAFVDELARCGLRHVCICPGSRSSPLAISFVRNQAIKTWVHLDERSASFFALGIARALGEPVALVCSSGTATANFFPAMIEAHQNSVPLLALTADRPPELMEWGALQTADQAGMYGSHTKWSANMPAPEATADLTLALPPRLTAGTGMDALGHCVEGIFAPTVNPPVEAIALDGIRRVCTYIERAVEDGTDREARWHMLMAALEGGMAIYKGLGPVHTLAHIFGDRPVHHGAAVAIATPAVVRFCAGDVGDKGDKILDAMGLARGSDLADGIAQLNERVGIPATMREIGYDGQDVDGLAQMGHENWFNATAPRHPSVAEYREMIVELLGT